MTQKGHSPNSPAAGSARVNTPVENNPIRILRMAVGVRTRNHTLKVDKTRKRRSLFSRTEPNLPHGKRHSFRTFALIDQEELTHNQKHSTSKRAQKAKEQPKEHHHQERTMDQDDEPNNVRRNKKLSIIVNDMLQGLIKRDVASSVYSPNCLSTATSWTVFVGSTKCTVRHDFCGEASNGTHSFHGFAVRSQSARVFATHY